MGRGASAIVAVAVAAALTVAAVAALGQLTSFGTLLSAARHANKAWLPLCLAGELVAYVGYVVAYRSVAAADGGPRLSLRAGAQVVTLGLGAYVVGSGAGGLAVDYWALRRAGSPGEEAARRMLALNTLQAAGLMTLAAAAGAAVLAEGAHGLVLVVGALWLGVVPAATIGAVAISQPAVARRVLETPEPAPRPGVGEPGAWPRWLWLQGRRAFGAAIGGVVVVRHVVAHPRRYAGGVVGYPLFWIGDVAILWTALAAFGLHFDPARLVVAEATAWVVSFVPLPGGGSGVAEASMAGMLHLVGAPLSVALSAAIVYRAVNFWLPLLPALALLPRAKRLRGELADSARVTPDADAALHVVGPRTDA